jgi:hypothetical protein
MQVADLLNKCKDGDETYKRAKNNTDTINAVK